MKLRIQGDSLRLRLTRKEVACLNDRGRVECAIRFSPGRALTYSVASSPDTAAVSVDFEGDSICVLLPASVVAAWAGTSQVTIEGHSQSGAHVLVEKDFQCLHQSSERDPEAYPNPADIPSSGSANYARFSKLNRRAQRWFTGGPSRSDPRAGALGNTLIRR
jgi:hypothetical protein